MRSRTDGSRPRVGYLVDVQEDFMRSGAPGGRLYVEHLRDADDEGAEQIIPRLRQLARWMWSECDAVVYTRDAHRLDDAEISSPNPDFVSTYPVHCAAYSPDAGERAGAEIIPEVAPSRPMLTLHRDATDDDARTLVDESLREGIPVLVEKSLFSVWTGNRAMPAFVEALAASLGARPEILVAGVASDVCVAQAIDGFLERCFDVTVVSDAIYSLGGDDDALLARWAERGVSIIAMDSLLGAGESPNAPFAKASAATARGSRSAR